MSKRDKPLVLLVEDDPMTSRLIEQKMKKGPFAFIRRENGKDGLKAVFQYHPDLLILDIGLPGISGYQVLQQVRKNSATADTRVMILTAEKLASVFHSFMQLKVQDFVVKPIDMHAFMIRVIGALQMSKGEHVQELGSVTSQSG